jgi:gliding motility-associated-like protein
MKFFLFCFYFASTSLIGMAQFGDFASAIKINTSSNNQFYNTTGNGTSLINPNPTPSGTPFVGQNLGTYAYLSNTLKITGAEVKTFKSPEGGNVCGAKLYYTYYLTATPPTSPIFTAVPLPFKADCNLVSGAFNDGLGPCSFGDQKWSTEALNINLTNTCPGNYTLDIYYDYNGADFNPTGCNSIKLIDNQGLRFQASFIITATLGGTANATNSSICSGQTINLNAAGSLGKAPYTYSWIGPNGFTSNSANPSITNAGTNATGAYIVTITDACGNTVQRTVNVTVTATPNAPSVTSPINYCQNATATTLTVTGTNLLWYTSVTGGTGTATAPIPNTSASDSTIYYVSQTVGGCESTRASIIINVTATPNAPSVTSPINYCQNASATALTVTGTNLLWYTSVTGGTGTATAPIPNTSASGSTIYYVSQTVGGCESTRASIIINVTATPNAPSVTSPINYCQNASATALTATGTNLLWYTSVTGGTGTATAPIPNTSISGSTIYYVSQSTSGGCESPRAIITVAITPLPQVNAGPDFTILSGDAITLSGTTNGLSYNWLPININNTLTPIVTPSTTTTYILLATSANGCVATDNTVVTVIPYCIQVLKAFTPNGDAINDKWVIIKGQNCTKRVIAKVYNRYGGEVYENSNYQNDWDGNYRGKKITDGTYYYLLEITLLNDKKVYLKGDVTVLR